MISIIKATIHDAPLLADIGKQTFLESHGKSAPPKDIDAYATAKYTLAALQAELEDPKNIYHILYYANRPAGFSKIIFDCPHPDIASKNITKLDRIYLLESFYGLNIGTALFDFNLNLSREHQQSGMWLYTWIENQRAIKFYLKHGFKIIGRYDFKVSDTHSNPNHHMFLEY